jgi:hypothetical protein
MFAYWDKNSEEHMLVLHRLSDLQVKLRMDLEVLGPHPEECS